MHLKRLLSVFLTLFISSSLRAQQYHFKDVKDLPTQAGLQDPFLKPDGSSVPSQAEWQDQRAYLKAMLKYYQYGEMPPKPDTFDIEPISTKRIWNDSVIQEIFYIVLSHQGKTMKFKAGIRRPNKAGEFPVIIKNDKYVFSLSDISDPSTQARYADGQRDKIENFAMREAYKRGYMICKFIRDEVALDNANYKTAGVPALYPSYNWGVIAAWAWAYQIVIDHLSTLAYVDTDKIVATGHSRGGKAALCAGVYEDRISITAPNSSGSGGTGSWRFFNPNQKPQTLEYHQEHYPYWWTSRIFEFVGHEEKMPFDAHFQKAVIAPRGLFNPHSREDFWANPYGTYLTFLGADQVFQWLGAENKQGVHWRNGPHSQNQEDWLTLFEFCDLYFYGMESEIDFKESPYSKTYHYDSLIHFQIPN